jgi:hypothetical protein
VKLATHGEGKHATVADMNGPWLPQRIDICYLPRALFPMKYSQADRTAYRNKPSRLILCVLVVLDGSA